MTEDIPDRMSDEQFAHVKYFLVFLFSYFLSDIIAMSLNRNVPQIFELLGRLFQDLTLPLFIVLFTLIIARLLLSLVPELSISQEIPLYVALLPPLIMTHPFRIALSGSNLNANWLVLDIFAENRELSWILQVLVFAFSGYALYMVQYRSKSRSSRMSQILRYLGKEILLSLLLIISSVYLLMSFISENYESLTLTMPVKLILVVLLAFGTLPISKDENGYSTKDIDEEDLK